MNTTPVAARPPDPHFWDRIAPKYAKRPVPDAAAYHATLDRVRSYLRPSQRALEIGCGTGTTALHLAPHVAHLLATDVSPTMVAIAREKASPREGAADGGVSNLEFRVGTLDDASLDPGGFEVVLAFNLFHLLGDLPATLARAGDLLAPGGLLLSKTPCLGETPWPLRGLVIPLLRLVRQAPFVNCFTGEELVRAVEGAGLTVLERGLYPAKSHSWFIAARKGG